MLSLLPDQEQQHIRNSWSKTYTKTESIEEKHLRTSSCCTVYNDSLFVERESECVCVRARASVRVCVLYFLTYISICIPFSLAHFSLSTRILLVCCCLGNGGGVLGEARSATETMTASLKADALEL